MIINISYLVLHKFATIPKQLDHQGGQSARPCEELNCLSLPFHPEDLRVSDLTLLRYYTRLTVLGVGQEIKVSLTQVAECLFTSPRHARNLVAKMQQQGWLNWQPKVGRNQRSILRLNLDLDTIKQTLAKEQILAGKYEKALTILDNDEVVFGRLLQSTSGASIREGRLHIQLTYKRPFERLVPHQIQRSSERFLLRQIYCCLIQCDEQGRFHPELAHHWEYDAQHFQWVFYLRPGLAFHDGSPIDANTIVSLFAKLSSLEEYKKELAHLVDVSAPQPQKVVFSLNQSDLGFAGLLSGVKYSIQPASQVNNAYSSMVTGCGPFQVQDHSPHKLILSAFDQFYGCRALTDHVTIWILNEDELYPQGMHIKQKNQQQNISCHHDVELSNVEELAIITSNQSSRVEDGCMFILFNQGAHSPLNENQKRYLATEISGEKLEHYLAQQPTKFDAVVASNLLPVWQPVVRPPAPKASLPNQISIAVYDYTVLIHCAFGVKHILEEMGLAAAVNIYSYRELNFLAQQGKLYETIVITNINLDDNRHFSAFSHLFGNPMLHHCIGPAESQWLLKALIDIRSTTPLTHYLIALEPLASSLINEYCLVPLFHHKQTLRFQGVLKDVALTNWGWPDIKNVWSID